MNENFLSDKNFLKLVLGFEIIISILIAAGMLPREYAFSVTVVMLIYIASSSLADSLILAILSIPFYLALPFTPSFDTMANWRIIILALFIKLVYEKFNAADLISKDKLAYLRHSVTDIELLKRSMLNKNIRFEVLALFFATISFLSLVGASNIGTGVKKILFLANIFLLFVIIGNVVRGKEMFLRIVKASILSGVFSLVIGYVQLISIFFVSLERFWQFWAENAIAAFYGANLSFLLSYSNTWFSYYQGDIPPTLRMFSVFPDSHSFSLFHIILIPFVLTLALCYKNSNRIRCLRYVYAILVLSLLAIIFSGSRGAWVSALIPLGIIIFIKFFNIKIDQNMTLRQTLDQKITLKLKDSVKNLRLKARELMKYLTKARSGAIVSTILLFFLLFPVSSVVLEQTQKAEWKRLNSEGDFSSFAMYKRLRSIMDLDEISNKGRIEIWRDTFASIKKHPMLGVGIGNFTTVIGKNITAAKKGASAHNLFLDIFAEMGILGLIVFLAIFHEIIKTAFWVFKNSTDDLYKFFALAAEVYIFWVLGYALFDVVLFNDKVLLLFMISTGLLYGAKRSLKVLN